MNLSDRIPQSSVAKRTLAATLLALTSAAGVASVWMAALDPSPFIAVLVAFVVASGVSAGAAFFATKVLRGDLASGRLRNDPAGAAIGHGLRFLIWFAGHNLLWGAAAGLIVVALLLLFGTTRSVMVVAAGLMACLICALLGCLLAMWLIANGIYQALGVCWPSSVPDGMENALDRAAATIFLPWRFLAVRERDLAQRNGALLLDVMAVLDWRKGGQSPRLVDLQDAPAADFRKEVLNRAVLFTALSVTTIVAATLVLPGNLVVQAPFAFSPRTGAPTVAAQARAQPTDTPGSMIQPSTPPTNAGAATLQPSAQPTVGTPAPM